MRSMPLLIASLFVLGLTYSAAAQTKPSDDPFDTSAAQKKIAELGVPTTASVADLEKQAGDLFTQRDCGKAIPALERFARQANWLANLVAAGVQPFYSASYDSRKNFGTGVSELVPYERMANEYKSKRDRAMVMQAECVISLGQKDRAVSLLVRSLDLISIDDRARREP